MLWRQAGRDASQRRPARFAGNRVRSRNRHRRGQPHQLDRSPNTVIATIDVGKSSAPQRVAVSPDGSHVYVATENANAVSAITTVTNSIPIGTYAVGTRSAPTAATSTSPTPTPIISRAW